MLGSTLVTPQTGPKGKLVSRIYVEAFTKVRKIFYAGLVIDRMNAAVMLLIADIKEQEISTPCHRSSGKNSAVAIRFSRWRDTGTNPSGNDLFET